MRSLLTAAGAVAVAVGSTGVAAAASAVPAALPPIKKSITRTTTYKAPMSGFVTVRSLGSDRSDWDLFVTDAASGRRLAASQGFGSHEVAQTWVQAGQRLTVRGVRRSGRAPSLPVTIQLVDVAPPSTTDRPALMRVRFDSNDDLKRIEDAGLDLTHHIHGDEADVIVTGAKQLTALRALNLPFETEIADMNAHFARSRKADALYAARVNGRSALPSGRTTYRDHASVQAELKALVTGNPGLVRPVILPHKTIQGREVQGIEIADHVERRDDGRPTYFVVAEHHAREWPSVEAAMELAQMLVQGQRSGDARITSLLARERIVIVPMVNPDGYVESRGFTPDPADSTGVQPLQTVEGVALLGGSMAYRRKNCNGAIPSGSVPCTLQYGVDPNRNYGEGWGGDGAGSDPITQSYRGTGPWSEPETQNIHEFSQQRHVTNIISIHNVAALVLRPPGRAADGKAPDEVRLKALGDAMADATNYTSQYGFQLYDTSGTTEDWNYAAQAAYGYTIEMGPKNGQFHMPYETGVVNQWNGEKGTKAEGRGLREALLLGAEAAANPADHAVVAGRAKGGAILRMRKEFKTMTSAVCRYAQGYSQSQTPLDCVAPAERIAVDDELDVTTVVPRSNRFEWHVNPSTRPFVGWRYVQGELTPMGRSLTFQPTEAENKYATGLIAQETEPLGDDAPAKEDEALVTREFDVAAGVDQLKAGLSWDAAPEDYDLRLWRVDENGQREPVGTGSGILGGSPGQSGNPPGLSEEITVDNPPAGHYVLGVYYYATAANDWTAKVDFFDRTADRVEPTGKTESWTLTCETPDGKILETKSITIKRGQRQDIAICARGLSSK